MGARCGAPGEVSWVGKLARVCRRGVAVLAASYAGGLATFLILRAALGDRPGWLGLANSFTIYAFVPLCVLLPLGLVVSRRRLTALLFAEAALGVWWIGCDYVPVRAAASAGAPLRVVTFNVWGGNPHRARVCSWLERAGADVVVLQEVGQRRFSEMTARLAASYPHAYAHPTAGDDWMNAVLSRHPITSWQDVAPSDPRAPLQRFTVSARGRALAVYVVHLDMPLHPGPDARHGELRLLRKAMAYDDSVRNRQIAVLLARVRAETLPFVVAGDFNLSDQSWTYRTVSAQLGDAFRTVGLGPGATWPADRSLSIGLPPLIRIDYIWHSPLLQPVAARTGPPLGSDHLPVVADFVFPAAHKS